MVTLLREVKKIAIEIRTLLNKQDLKGAKQGLVDITKLMGRMQEGGKPIQRATNLLRQLKKETAATADQMKEGAEQSKAFSLQMINLRDAGSAFVIQAQKIDQIMTTLRETFLDFSIAQQQFLVLGEALGTVIEDEIAARVDELAIRFGVAQLDIIMGLRDIAAMGIPAGDAINFMEVALLAATAGMGDAAETGQTLLKIIRAFGLEFEDATVIAAQMAFVANETSLNVQDMTAAMQFAATQVGVFGGDFAETAAIIGIMTDAAVSNGIAGRAMRQTIMRLINPTAEAKDAIEELGIELTDEEGNFLSIATILRNVADATAGFTQQQKLAAIATIFQTRGQVTLNSALLRGLDDMDDLISRTRALGTDTEALTFLLGTSGDMLDSTGTKWAQLDARQTAAAKTIAENVVPAQIWFREQGIAGLEMMAQMPPIVQQIGGGFLQLTSTLLGTAGNIFLLTTSFITAKAAMKNMTPDIDKTNAKLLLTKIRAIGASKAFALAAASMGLLVFGMLAFQAETPAMRAAFSIAAAAASVLAIKMFLVMAGLSGATLGIATGVIAAAVAAVLFIASSFQTDITSAIGAQQGLLINSDKKSGVFINDVGETEVISPVPLIRETFREVIRESPQMMPQDRANITIIVEGPIFGLEEVEAVIDRVVSESLRSE